MVTSDLRAKVEIWLFRICAMHPAIIIMNSSFIVDLAMGQIPRSTERISSFNLVTQHVLLVVFQTVVCQRRWTQ